MVHGKEKSKNTKSRLIGGLFLLAFILYGGGTALALNGQMIFGMSLILTNSVVVIVIGLLVKSILEKDSPLSANIYFFTRLSEALLLGIGAIALTFVSDGGELNTTLYRLAMIILGLGSIVFCRWLIATRVIYVPLAWLGYIGYPLMTLSMVAEFLGYGNFAIILLIPGAVFELTFGILLLLVGLRSPINASQKVDP
ncbi:DUF4386 family protein [uncultured Psychrosphaera sp.]|uniref:DUF4386 family protein n=1 Tax=uncultured Psychrosphaera sp. TaxID=1403522 RepID=UPI0026183810|nr:DUF4386 family protein [uncultured Psychrosphaera sp.]